MILLCDILNCKHLSGKINKIMYTVYIDLVAYIASSIELKGVLRQL